MRIAVGVTGGIAAYKAAEIVRLLQDCGVKVQVIMTHGAQEFIRPLTFAALTGQKVITGMFGPEGAEAAPNLDSAVEHIAVAQNIDALLVAPATADILAKFANGIADDFLTTLFLATKAPVIVAPAMNVVMWENAATQTNIATLRSRGVLIVEPESGYLACGMVGAGRLAAQEQIVSRVLDVLHISHELRGRTVLVTAGPTREPIDPVRYIGNRSSGKMGYAIAEAARNMGANVVLVSGPVNIQAPEGVEVNHVETAAQMREAVLKHAPSADIIIKAAAVADFTPTYPQPQKIKRKGPLTIDLQSTEDVLAEVSKSSRKGQVLIGFAAETQNAIENARGKLVAKSIDAIIVNDVSKPDIGFDSDRNAVTILTKDDSIELPEASKTDIARQLMQFIAKMHSAREVKI